MQKIVIDASVVASWLFPDEKNDYAEKVKEDIINGTKPVVPLLFLSEISNLFLSAEKRKRITVSETHIILHDFSNLPITINFDLRLIDIPELTDLARRNGLTSYDATYLFTAKLLGIPIATLDKDLIRASKDEKVILWNKA